MANVLIETLNLFNQVEKALNRMLGDEYFAHDGTTTDDGSGNIDTVNITDDLSIEADGNGDPTNKRIINADKAIRLLQELTQDQLDSIKGRFGNVDMVAYIQANMVDQSTVNFYKPED